MPVQKSACDAKFAASGLRHRKARRTQTITRKLRQGLACQPAGVSRPAERMRDAEFAVIGGRPHPITRRLPLGAGDQELSFSPRRELSRPHGVHCGIPQATTEMATQTGLGKDRFRHARFRVIPGGAVNARSRVIRVVCYLTEFALGPSA